jgi:hypothetical protein
VFYLQENKKRLLGAKYSTMRLFTMSMESEVIMLEEPYLISSHDKIQTNLENGYFDIGRCHSYVNPLNCRTEYVYTATRYYIFNNSGSFLGGTLYIDSEVYNVTGQYVMNPHGFIVMELNPFNLDLDNFVMNEN